MPDGDLLRNADASATGSFSNAPLGQTVAPCPLAKEHWIEIHLVDNAGKPLAREPYIVYPPGQDPITGELDENGHARQEHLNAGACKVVFPSRELLWWDPNPPVTPPPLPVVPPPVVAELPVIADHWIEINLKDDAGRLLPFEPYELHLASGSVQKGELDEFAFARHEGLAAAAVKVVFPRRENSWWQPTPPPTPPPPPEPIPDTVAALPEIHDAWIEVRLLDDAGRPIPNERIEIRDGTTVLAKAETDGTGLARVEGLTHGSCQIVMPRRDQSWWTDSQPPATPPAVPAISPEACELPPIFESEEEPVGSLE